MTGDLAGPSDVMRADHRSVLANVALGKWMSAALDDPKVCAEMKADIEEWFSAGHPPHALTVIEPPVLSDIAAMMSEFVENYPRPKKISTALALIAKTIRAALNPPQHDFWGAGEPDCPRDIKAGNGELHTMRCKRCGQDNPLRDACAEPCSPTPITGDDR